MPPQELNGQQVVTIQVVMNTARQFCEVFKEIPQFKAYQDAEVALRNDAKASAASLAYQSKLGSLRIPIKLKNVSEQDYLELQKLRDVYDQMPSVVALNKADQNLRAVSQKIGDIFSESIEMDFGNRCRVADNC